MAKVRMRNLVVLAIFAAMLVGGLVLAMSSDARRSVLGAAMTAEAHMAGLARRKLRIDDHDIVYLERPGSAPDATAIILLHGFTAEKNNWPRMVRHLDPRYRVIAPDWPAHGESTYIPGGDYSLSRQAARLLDVMNLLKIDSAHLVGNSMGGAIAAQFAARHPTRVRTLVLMNAGGADNPKTQSQVEAAMKTGKNPLLVTTPENFAATISLAMEKPPWIPWPVNVAMAELAAQRSERFAAVFEQVHSGVTNTRLEYLRSITAPTLVMWGDRDRILDVANAEVFHAALPTSEVVIYEGVGHMPMLEVPRRAAQDITAFIANN